MLVVEINQIQHFFELPVVINGLGFLDGKVDLLNGIFLT